MISENVVFSLGSHDLGSPHKVEQVGVRALIKQCQDFILLVISEGHTADELLQSKHIFPALDRDIYKSAIDKLIAISLSSPNPEYESMLTWVVDTLSRSNRKTINQHMDGFYNGYLLKFPELQEAPLDDFSIFKGKEFLDAYQVFHAVDEQRILMDYVIADDPRMVERIAGALREEKRGLDTIYLQLQKYEGTKKVRNHIHGTLEMSFSEIHEKLLGMFSIDGRTSAQQGMGVTYNTVWDDGLMKLPRVMAYIETAGFEFLRDLTSLALRPRNLIQAHFDANKSGQCGLISEIVRKIDLSVHQVAKLFYCGVLNQGIGKVMDLQERGESEYICKLVIDLCNYDEPQVEYVNSMTNEMLKSLPMKKVIESICRLSSDRSDYVLAKLYEKTSDKSILPHLKEFAVKGKVFTFDLGV